MHPPFPKAQPLARTYRTPLNAPCSFPDKRGTIFHFHLFWLAETNIEGVSCRAAPSWAEPTIRSYRCHANAVSKTHRFTRMHCFCTMLEHFAPLTGRQDKMAPVRPPGRLFTLTGRAAQRWHGRHKLPLSTPYLLIQPYVSTNWRIA